MSALAECSNFGACRFAGQPKWDARADACPNCGRSLASPHRVTLGPAPNCLEEGGSFPLRARLKTAGCARAVRLSLVIDGGPDPIVWDIPESSTEREQEHDFDEIPGLSRGVYRCRAVLETSDGRKTSSNEDLLYFTQPPDIFSLWVWALLLMIILSVGVGLAWIGEPLLEYPPPAWLPPVKSLLSLIVPLIIGALFLDLGLRQLRSEEARSVSGGDSDLRPLILPNRLAETFPRAAGLVSRYGPSLGLFLSVVGALLIAFVAARLTSLGSPWWGEAIVSVVGVVAFLAILAMILIPVWPRKRQSAAGADTTAQLADSTADTPATPSRNANETHPDIAADGAPKAADDASQKDGT